MTDEQITDAVVARKKAANQSLRFFRAYDLLLTPTIAGVPFGHGIQGPELIEGKKAAPFQWITFTYQFNMTGQPAATVPAAHATRSTNQTGHRSTAQCRSACSHRI